MAHSHNNIYTCCTLKTLVVYDGKQHHFQVIHGKKKFKNISYEITLMYIIKSLHFLVLHYYSFFFFGFWRFSICGPCNGLDSCPGCTPFLLLECSSSPCSIQRIRQSNWITDCWKSNLWLCFNWPGYGCCPIQKFWPATNWICDFYWLQWAC